MMKEEILRLSKKASINILADDKVLEIKQIFRIGDKSTIGVLIFLCAGIFLIVIPFIKTSDIYTKIIGVALGLFLFVLSILTLIRQFTDGLIIKDKIITLQHKLKRSKIQVNDSMKIKMRTDVFRIKRSGTPGSEFIHVHHYLLDKNNEIPILSYQMDNKDADEAKELGKEITSLINEKIKSAV